VDEGLGADFMADDAREVVASDQTLQADKTAITAPINIKDSDNSSPNGLDEASVIQIVEAVIKQQFQKNQAIPSNPIETEKTEQTESDSIDQLNDQPKQDAVLDGQESSDIDTEKDQQLAQYKADLEQSKANQTVLEQQLFERLKYEKTQASNLQDYQQKVTHLEQQAEQIQSQYQRLQEKDINHHVNTQLNNNIQNPINTPLSNLSLEELANLEYPSQLTPEERASIQVAVGRAGSREQDILNLLTIRLNNGNTPPNNNVSYLASLVNRHRRGELDFSALSAFKSPKKVQADKALKVKLWAMVDEYREYDIKRRHYEKGVEKKNIKGKIVLSGSDFDKKHYQSFYDLAYKAYHEIKAYVKNNHLDENLISHL
jgi:hypothetical protein